MIKKQVFFDQHHDKQSILTIIHMLMIIAGEDHDKQSVFTMILMIILLPVNESTEGATILPRAAHIRNMYPRVTLKYSGFSHDPIAPITLLYSFAFLLISLAQPSCTTPQELWCRARPWWSSRCSSTWSASTPPARSCSECCSCPRPCRSCPSPPWWYNPCPPPARSPPPAPPEGQGHPPDARPSQAVVGALDKVQPRPHHSDHCRCRWTLVMTVLGISAKYSATQRLKSENSVRPK